MAQIHGGRLVAQALKRHDIDMVFTLCGGHVQAIYDGCIDEEIRVVDTRHEQTAGFAADAHARVSGKPGVAIVTAGPGVTNTVTALANAQRAGVPLVCIGGSAPSALSHMGSLQDVNAVDIMASVTKWSVRVTETARIKEYVDSAFRIARSGAPGPVYLEIPVDVLMRTADSKDPATRPSPPPRPCASASQIQRVVQLLETSERPAFILGSQLRWSSRSGAVKRAAEHFEVPVFLNGMARGGLPTGHPNLFSRSRRHALSRADLTLVLGTPLDFRLDYGRSPSWNPEGAVVQVDLAAEILGQNRGVEVAIQSDSGAFLDQLLTAAPARRTPEWLAELRAVEEEKVASQQAEASDPDDAPDALLVCDELGKRLGERDIVIGDGGDFVATAAHAIPLSADQLWMDPGPFGSLGVGPGFALAAGLLRPRSRTVILFGDGAFGLSVGEFEALARHGLNVVAVIGNDAGWTQVRRAQEQLFGEDRAVATKLDHSRYEKVVEAFGGRGYWVDRVEDLGPALDAAFENTTPSCVNVKLSPSDLHKATSSI